jgi:hypothetical protein
MNTDWNNTTLDDSRFDRLVDGELSDEERRGLLSKLDDQPDGWRRCALAFLEAQSWKQTFQMIPRSEPQASVVREMPKPHVHPHRLPWKNHLGTFAAMAASFLMVFYIGSLLLRTSGDRIGGWSQVAQTRPIPTTHSGNGTHPWHIVTVAAPVGSPVRVPAVERENIDPNWLQHLPPAIPDDVMQAFHRTGHQVQQQRELVPVPLQDGRQLVVPVDQVNVHYVGDGPY